MHESPGLSVQSKLAFERVEAPRSLTVRSPIIPATYQGDRVQHLWDLILGRQTCRKGGDWMSLFDIIDDQQTHLERLETLASDTS